MLSRAERHAERRAEREVFANRTLNLRSVSAIGYDMDYTLIQYRTDRWEAETFEHARRLLVERGWPAEGLIFDPHDFLQGLVIDSATGNLVKATRFGYVIQAHHGTRPLEFAELRSTYAGVFVELEEPRWDFLNTMFSLSEAALFAQLVDRLDAGEGPVVAGYDDLHRAVRRAIDDAHAGGELKARIQADPERYVIRDPELLPTLVDQRAAGKSLLLITNSEWSYTETMMSWYLDDELASLDPDSVLGRALQGVTKWSELFDIIVVAAGKPGFFAEDGATYRVVDASTGALLPYWGPLEGGAVYHGSSAVQVERSLGLDGDQILYVGDHLFGDVHASKATLRWRTALILHELEDEIRAAAAFAESDRQLRDLMAEKIEIEQQLAQLRLDALHGTSDRRSIDREIGRLRRLDERIGPLARASAVLGHQRWGPLMRAGNDKSLFARQVERSADIYTSRVSNLGLRTPFARFRAPRTSLPHDLAP